MSALEDIRVIDLTDTFWAGLTGALLGDFGADVTRVEPLPAARAVRSERLDDDGVRDGWDARFELAHRNKRSVAIDLDHADGRALLGALVRSADVVVTDWSLARLAELGLDHATLSAAVPGIITARGSAFGPRGPDRDAPPIDELAAARTGMMPILPQPGEPPVNPGHGAMYTTVMLAVGVLLALHHRAETGEGQAVDASLFGGHMYGASLDVQAYLAMGGQRFLEPVSRLDAGNPMSGVVYRAEDGRWLCLTMPDTDRWWPHFADLVGIAVDDPRFDSHEKRCGEHRLELIRVLDEAVRRAPASHWKRVFDERKLSADVIEEYDFPASDPQALRNRYVVELDRAGVGAVKSLGFPLHLGDGTARLGRTAPCLGQHTAEVLAERLELDADAIVDLVDRGVVA